MYLLIYFWRQSLTLSPKLEYSSAIMVHCSLHFPGWSNPLTSASSVAGTTGARHHAWLVFCIFFLVETGFHRVSQDDLDLLTLWSACLGLPKCWDYRLEPLHPAKIWFSYLHAREVSQSLRLFSMNSRYNSYQSIFYSAHRLLLSDIESRIWERKEEREGQIRKSQLVEI